MSGEVFQTRTREYVKPDLLLRTRRSVMEAAHLMHAKRTRHRRHAGITLLVVAGLLVLFAPALWSAASDLTTGEHFFEMPIIVVTFSLVLLAAMVAILLTTWKRSRRGASEE